MKENKKSSAGGKNTELRRLPSPRWQSCRSRCPRWPWKWQTAKKQEQLAEDGTAQVKTAERSIHECCVGLGKTTLEGSFWEPASGTHRLSRYWFDSETHRPSLSKP